MQILGSNSIENRINFNRESKRSRFQIKLSRDYKLLSHRLESGYVTAFDNSDIDIGDNPYTNKSAFYGYGLDIHPIDSLTVFSEAKYFYRREQDRFAIDKTNYSRGYSYRYGGRMGFELADARIGVNGDYEEKSLDREQNHNQYLAANAVYYGYSYDFYSNLSYRKRREELYILQADSIGITNYTRYDRLAQEQINSMASVRIYPSNELLLIIDEQYHQHKNRRSIDLVNDNADFKNRFALQMQYAIQSNVNINTQIRNDFSIKDYSYTKASNITDIKALDNKVSWEYSPGDSLITAYLIEMKRSKFPNDDNIRDKDTRKQVSRLGWTMYFRSRMRMNSWLIWNNEDEVSINALYSANNKKINSLSLLPEWSILLGDKILVKQAYTIRADYTGYIYSSEQYRDNLYRQLGVRYSILFDDYPYIARSGDPIWLRLPYRKPSGNAFSTELSFQFEQNEFGYQVDDYYLISTKNRKFISQINLKYDIQDLYIFIQPKYSWGTWKEYSLLLGMAGQFNNTSVVEFSFNPIGTTLSELDYRFSFNLKLQF